MKKPLTPREFLELANALFAVSSPFGPSVMVSEALSRLRDFGLAGEDLRQRALGASL